jgi:dihydroorotate dehydrogenase electron transfer subunit
LRFYQLKIVEFVQVDIRAFLWHYAGMYEGEAIISARLEAMPGWRIVHLQSPAIARAACPGQFVMALRDASCDPYLRVALPLHQIGRVTITLLLDQREAEQARLAEKEIGESIDLLGPLGHGFEIASGTQRLLLIAQGAGIVPLVGLAERALATGRQVALVALADRAERLYPAELLARNIEYHGRVHEMRGTGALPSALAELLTWADQICAAGSEGLYAELRNVLAQRPARSRSGAVQVWRPGRIGCGMGLCQACAFETKRGIKRACSDGPVFDLFDLG